MVGRVLDLKTSARFRALEFRACVGLRPQDFISSNVKATAKH